MCVCDVLFTLLVYPPVSGGEDGLSVTRITEIVGASPLTDDDIQQLLSVLLEKMNTNSEWEAVSGVSLFLLVC